MGREKRALSSAKFLPSTNSHITALHLTESMNPISSKSIATTYILPQSFLLITSISYTLGMFEILSLQRTQEDSDWGVRAISGRVDIQTLTSSS